MLHTSDFDFELPPELIASHPLQQRDASRMLVVHGNDLADRHIRDFVDYLQPGDVVVFNNSRVIPARFNATDSHGTAYEITLHTAENDKTWWGLCKKFNKIPIDEILTLDDGTTARVLDKKDDSGLKLEFMCDNVFAVLDAVGKMPLPPYMKRDAEESDRTRYQTVYAEPLGSMAAPTAGLHFTPELLDRIRAKGVQIATVLLHVGLGTFRPVKEENVLDHKMHSEYYRVDKENAAIITKAKKEGRRVICVGTTSVRVLESVAKEDGAVEACSGDTDIFIYPGYKFKAVDALITNFHLPQSTLLMLVSAFMGRENALRMYETAVGEGYRFFSFGDATFII